MMEELFSKFHQICGSIEVKSGVFNGNQESVGTYFLCDEIAVGAPKNPVWKLHGKDRYIFNNGSSNGWRIGDNESLTLGLGDFYYKSKKVFELEITDSNNYNHDSLILTATLEAFSHHLDHQK